MTQDEAATHWQQRARSELKAARVLFDMGDRDLYGEVLFHCHLALELALKSRYIREKDSAAPYTHDLNELAGSLRSVWTPGEQHVFENITGMGILSRYGDEEWYASNATKEKASECLQKAEELISKIFS